jgi:hypothetical protein
MERFFARKCEQCGKEFLTEKRRTWDPRRGRFCSIECRNKWIKENAWRWSRPQDGENNHNWKGGISKNHYRYKLRQVERFPERIRARRKAAYAIHRGKLLRGPCEMCGKPDAHAHHDDYTKPLEVRWLCKPCHNKYHAEKNRSKSQAA